MNPETIRDYAYTILLKYPPMHHDPANVRNLVSDILPGYNFASVNFSSDQSKVLLSNPQGQQAELTKLAVGEDTIALEKAPIQGGTIRTFLPVVEDVVRTITNRLGLQVFLQENVIRVIANPLGTQDSRVFMGDRVCRFGDNHIRVFGRPVHAIGLRWYFPPSPDDPSVPEYDVKIETLIRDAKLIFIENKGLFQQPIPAQEMRTVLDNIQMTRDFIDSRIVNFLTQFNPSP